MRNMFLVLCILMSSASFAEVKFAAGGGLLLNQNDTDVDTGQLKEEISASLNLSSRVLIPLNESWFVRSGLGLQEKSAKFSYDFMGFEGDISLNTISATIPLNIQFKINDKVSVFGGYSVDSKINEYCNADGDFERCSLYKDAESLVHHVMIGFSIWGNEKLDVDVSYQHALSEMFDDIKVHSLMAQLFYKF